MLRVVVMNAKGGCGKTTVATNLAVALGNAPSTAEVLEALRAREAHPSALVREHVAWAIARHEARAIAEGSND